MEYPVRKTTRLTTIPYDQPGSYFITVCTANREKLFWSPAQPPAESVGADIIRPQHQLSKIGQVLDQSVQKISTIYPAVKVDHYMIMPDHIHLLITIEPHGEVGGRIISAPTKGIPTIVGQMKRAVTKAVGRPIWQKGYHDHVIRNDRDYQEIWKYIETNPYQERES